MLKIEKIKEEILNFDMVNFGENLECYFISDYNKSELR